MDTESLLQDAFAHLGVEARIPLGAAAGQPTLVLDPEGAHAELEVVRRTLVDGQTAERLVSGRGEASATLMVVGDRVTEAARRHLLAARAGYLDLRGHLGLRSGGLVISADVPSVNTRQERSDPLSGRVGLEVATRLLMAPTEPVAVRELARTLERSPSTVSSVLAALRRDGLLDQSNAVADSGLFWRVADKWRAKRTYLVGVPPIDDAMTARVLKLGLEDVEAAPGWALTDTVAAAAYGAPVAFRHGQQLDFLVPDESVVQRAARLLGVSPTTANASVNVRVAPVPIATNKRVVLDGAREWPLAHPLFVALDLAQDVGRGREILDTWTPDERWPRVW